MKIELNLTDENWLLIEVYFDGIKKLSMIRDLFMVNGEDLEDNEVLIDPVHYNEDDAYEKLLQLSLERELEIATFEDYHNHHIRQMN